MGFEARPGQGRAPLWSLAQALRLLTVALAGGRGPIEAELYRGLEEAAARDPKAKEALSSESGLEVSPTELIGLILAKQAALEQAVLRLAREIDAISSR